MKASFEKFLIWYIPFAFISFLAATAAFVLFGTSTNNYIETSFQLAPGELLLLINAIKIIAFSASNIIAAIWMLYQPHSGKGSRVLWASFALLSGLWSIGLWLILHLFRELPATAAN